MKKIAEGIAIFLIIVTIIPVLFVTANATAEAQQETCGCSEACSCNSNSMLNSETVEMCASLLFLAICLAIVHFGFYKIIKVFFGG